MRALETSRPCMCLVPTLGAHGRQIARQKYALILSPSSPIGGVFGGDCFQCRHRKPEIFVWYRKPGIMEGKGFYVKLDFVRETRFSVSETGFRFSVERRTSHAKQGMKAEIRRCCINIYLSFNIQSPERIVHRVHIFFVVSPCNTEYRPHACIHASTHLQRFLCMPRLRLIVTASLHEKKTHMKIHRTKAGQTYT